jgi:hypothetical protein
METWTNNAICCLASMIIALLWVMDAREDLPKVSIETEQDWRRIQQNLSAALLARLDTELESYGQAADKSSLLPHVHQVNSLWFVRAHTKLL